MWGYVAYLCFICVCFDHKPFAWCGGLHESSTSMKNIFRLEVPQRSVRVGRLPAIQANAAWSDRAITPPTRCCCTLSVTQGAAFAASG